MPDRSDFKAGEVIFFGRDRGEKTKGEIIKLNPKRAKVKQLEGRGTNKAHDVGTIWTVPYSLIDKIGEHGQPLPREEKPIEFDIFQDAVEVHILLAINAAYTALSPENLTCDGEAPHHMVRERQSTLNRQLAHLQEAFGRPVSEEAAWKWQEGYAAHQQKRRNAG